MAILQKIKSVFTELNFLALLLYLAAATQGIASSYKQGAVRSIERRYYLNSRETGFIFGVYDGVFLVMLFVVSFYLDRVFNRLVVVASGVLTLAIGLFTFSLPHYFVVDEDLAGVIQIHEKAAICSNVSAPGNMVTTGSDWLRSFLWKCFLPGNILIAIGSTPLYTTGVALLGHNSAPQSLYEPIFYCIAMLSPAIGMVINSKFLQLFVNHGVSKPAWLTVENTDPQWLGAWWIGFLINSLVALVLACVLFICACYFRTIRLDPVLKKSATVEKRLSELSPSNSNCCTRFFYRALHRMKLDEALHAVTSLLSNSYFTFMSLYATTEFAANGSISNNMIKFLEIQFAKPSSKVSMELGITGFIAAALGLPVGCYLNKLIGKRHLSIIKLDLVVVLVHLALMFVFAWPCTESSKYAGVHYKYDAQFSQFKSKPALISTCNNGCNCYHNDAHYAPVCASGPDGSQVTFLSACFAGCRSKRNNTYEDCSCLQGTIIQNATMREDGSCVKACGHHAIIYLMIFIAFFLSIATAIPNISSVLASFPDQYKSVACSLQWLSLRLFGSITSSMIYAEFIKDACIFHVSPSTDSACLLYDHTAFGWAMAGPSIFYKSLGLLFVICAFVCEVRRVPDKRQNVLADPNNNNRHSRQQASLLANDLELSVASTAFQDDSQVRPASANVLHVSSLQMLPENSKNLC